MNIEKIKKKSRNTIRKLVKDTMLKKEDVILLLDDLRVHFRKNGWALNYHVYLELSKLEGMYFDQLLHIKNYKVVHTDGSLLIVKKVKK